MSSTLGYVIYTFSFDHIQYIIKLLKDFASTKSLSDLTNDFFSFIFAILVKCGYGKVERKVDEHPKEGGIVSWDLHPCSECYSCKKCNTNQEHWQNQHMLDDHQKT
jgi:hypothetical protein